MKTNPLRKFHDPTARILSVENADPGIPATKYHWVSFCRRLNRGFIIEERNKPVSRYSATAHKM